ncbi:MAG: PKD domain-containing protein [bacterium]
MKSFIVLVFMIFTLVSSTKADGWTNAGEFSYLYPNGTKQITDYTLTKDGKSIVVITTEGNNTFRLNRFDLEAGLSDFDTLWITNKYSYKLSRDGLSAFEIYQTYQNYYCHVDYNLFDIFHSSKGYLYKEVLFDNNGNPYHNGNLSINYLNFLYKDNLLIQGTTINNSDNSPPDHTNASSGTWGIFKIFDISNPNNIYKNEHGATEIYDYYNGMNNIVFYHHSNSYNVNYGSSSKSSVVLVDSNINEIPLFPSDENNKAPKILKLIGDSLLIIHKEVNKNNNIYYYDRKTNEFRYIYKFPFVNGNASFKLGLSNDGNYLVKSDGNKIQFYKSNYNYAILDIQIPDSLSNYTNYTFTKDDKLIFMLNNKNRFVKFENPIKNNNFRALFTISDSILLAGRIYQTFNCSTGNPNSYSWDFGNDLLSNEVKPEFKFNAPGKYTITLTAEKDGKFSSQIKEVTVLPDYSVGFEIVSIPEYLPIICKFKNTSTDNIDSLVWDFGDGTYSKSKDVDMEHLFAKEAEYNVKLKVYYNRFIDSVEKKVIIKDIKEAPLDPNIYSEYNFENTSQNHQKFYKVYETKDKGFIFVALNKDKTNLIKTSVNLLTEISLLIAKPPHFQPIVSLLPDNFDDIYFENTLQFNNDKFVVAYSRNNYSMVDVYNSQLLKVSSFDSTNTILISLALPINNQNESFLCLQGSGSAAIYEYNITNGKSKIFKNDFSFQLLPSKYYFDMYKFYNLYSAFTPIYYNYCYHASYQISSPFGNEKLNFQFPNSSLNLKKDVYFYAFRNIDTTTFVGLDINGNIYKFNANGDSLNKIALAPGLRNIAVNGSLYYAVGFKDNHPVCYAFDNDLNMKDTIYIEQRDGAFLDALVCKSGDLVLVGYKYIPSKTDTAGKLLRSSYILKINKYSETKDSTKSIPISITNPIDHLATIIINADTSTTFRYEVFDLMGNKAFTSKELTLDYTYQGTIDFTGLAPGVYIFKFFINGIIETKKVIYQK